MLHRTLLILGLAALSAPGAFDAQPARAQSAQAGWHTSFAAAEAEAKRLDRPLLLHFHASWCAPCRQMEGQVLNQGLVLNKLRDQVVAVKLDVDQNQDLAARFGVNQLPSDVIVEPEGSTMLHSTGMQSLSSYLGLLDRAAGRYGALREQRIAKENTHRAPEGQRIIAEERGNATRVTEVSQPSVALNGYSPVSLNQGRKWEKGTAEFAATHRGQTYWLTSAQQQAQFDADPRKYVPRMLGCDPIVLWKTDRAVSGDLKFAAFYKDELYLFATSENRDEFKKSPDRYTSTRVVLKVEDIEQVLR